MLKNKYKPMKTMTFLTAPSGASCVKDKYKRNMVALFNEFIRNTIMEREFARSQPEQFVNVIVCTFTAIWAQVYTPAVVNKEHIVRYPMLVHV